MTDSDIFQTIFALAMHKITKIPIRDRGNDLADFKLFEDYLNLEIHDYNTESELKYKSGNLKDTKIYILYIQSHYDAITNINAFACSNSKTAQEKFKCYKCKSKTKCIESTETKVSTYNKSFCSPECYDNHIANNNCISKSYICSNFNKSFKSNVIQLKDHKCYEFQCYNCKLWFPDGHKYYMNRKYPKPLPWLPTDDPKYIFYDIKTKLDENNKHIVNYAIAQYYNGNEVIFTNIDDFYNWAFTKAHTNYTFIAHFGQGYDALFIISWLISHSIKPTVIPKGNKIMLLEVHFFE